MGKTEIIFVLDRSGSMSGLEDDVIGGFNSYIKKQMKEEGETFVTTILFDQEYQIIYNHVNIKEIPELTNKEYYPRGMTALLDAVGSTIDLVSSKVNNDDHIIFMINTDGLENASKEYSYELVNKMIKNRESWEFVFLGARIDAIHEASKLGIRKERAVRYFEAGDGIQESFDCLSAMTTNIRCCKMASMDESWKDGIQENYKKHTGKK